MTCTCQCHRPPEYVPSPLARMAAEQLLTVAEAAARLAVSQDTVRAAISRGDLEVRRIGRAVRVPAATLVGFGQPRPLLEFERCPSAPLHTTRKRPYNRVGGV